MHKSVFFFGQAVNVIDSKMFCHFLLLLLIPSVNVPNYVDSS
jgi:hypothetical protein